MAQQAARLLVIVLNEPSKLNDAVTALVEAGVTGATVVESQGMGKILAQDIPIFAGFRHLMAHAHPHNHFIFSVVEDLTVVDAALEALKDTLHDDSAHGHGVWFTLPVERHGHLEN